MYEQGAVDPVFSMALSRPGDYEPDGYIALGGLPPVATYGEWATVPIEILPEDDLGIGTGYFPTNLPYPQHGLYPISLNK